MKKSLVVLMVVAMLLVSAVPAFAAKGGPAQPPAPNKGGQFTLVGTITAIAGEVVTVKVVSGYPIARPFVGQAVALLRKRLEQEIPPILSGLDAIAIRKELSIAVDEFAAILHDGEQAG